MAPGIRGNMKFMLQKASLANVSAIITDSHNSKADIEKYLGIDPGKVFVTHLAVDEDFKAQTQKPFKSRKIMNLPEKYALFVGDINVNKNIPLLINAFDQADVSGDLVIVSRALKATNIKESKAIIQEVSHAHKKGKIHLMTDVESDSLPSLYHWAECYIQPSLYEGFGLPLLEAFESKIPVLSSNASSLPEVGGSAPIYFNPTSLESIAMALEKGLTLQDSERDEMIRQGSLQAEKFSWVETARQTVDVYKKVVGKAL
jgi:glycosyltransferase involved in cell wall biosynthesis